jgi:hypothetical protein
MGQMPHDECDTGGVDAMAPMSLLGRFRIGCGTLWGRVEWGMRLAARHVPVPVVDLDHRWRHGRGDGPGRDVDSLLLAAALADMPQLEATVFRLHYEEGLSFEAVGRRLGLDPDVVLRHCVRALKQLRRTYAVAPRDSLWGAIAAGRSTPSGPSDVPSIGPAAPGHGSC